jgi:putative ABC transport system permease protein
MNPRLGRKLAAIRGVEGISPTSYFNVELVIEGREAETLAFRAIDPENYERVASFQFAAGQGDEAKLLERLSQGNAVFISTVVSDKYNLKKGDTIRLKTARGERDFLVAGIIVDWLERGYAITGTRDDMYRYFAKRGVDTFVVKLKEEEMISEMERLIEERFGKGEHIEVKSNEELKSSILAYVEQQFALFNVLVSIGIIIAGLGVVNTLTMNVLERTREIGVLRALGMTGGQVAKMVLAEALSMGAIGGLYGLSFGSFLSRVFLFSTNAITGYQVSYTFPVSSLLTGAVIALFVSQIAALYPVLRATGINIIRAVQYE